jgi:hypothetical protein
MASPRFSMRRVFLMMAMAWAAAPIPADEDHARTHAWNMEQGGLVPMEEATTRFDTLMLMGIVNSSVSPLSPQ